MDLALDHLALKDINYNRFALMLVDNAMELTLHKFAEGKNSDNKMWEPLGKIKHDPKLVSAALGQHFEEKVKLAKAFKLISDETSDSINTLHSFRNQIYHLGMQHERILPAISLFYFRIACNVFERYEPEYFSWGSDEVLPHRAMKYFGAEPFDNPRDLYKKACTRLKEVSEGISVNMVESLSLHMQETIEHADEMIDFLSCDSPEPKDRDQVIIGCQSWPFALTDKGKAFARDKNSPAKTVAEHVEWIEQNYSWPMKNDPIPSWKKRLLSLKKEKDEHSALKKYKNFMDQTESIREQINESAALLEQHIQQQIDIARGK